MTDRHSVDRLLDDARKGLDRLAPEAAYEAAQDGGVLVDIRSGDEQRAQGVVIPVATHHPLSVLLWRLDPDVPTESPKLPLETQVILICRQGYSSTLAAQQLRTIGFTRATDVVGGVEGWVGAGLPTEPAL